MSYIGKTFHHPIMGLCQWVNPSSSHAVFVSLEGDKKGAGFQCGFDMQAKWMGEVVEEVDTVKKKGKK
jgi:hypothetical protein